jgi:protein ImuB
LAVWCAEWSTVATGRPPEVPLVVLHANRVVAASPGARDHGVGVGLRRREAQARCPAIELHERDEQRDARAFEVVLGALEQLVPRLEVSEPGRCAFPTRGPSRYHGGDRALAALVLDRVRAALIEASLADGGSGRLPCPVGIGLADGPRTAALAAEEAVRRDGGRTPLLVPEGRSAAFLAPLQVERLDASRPASAPARTRRGQGRSGGTGRASSSARTAAEVAADADLVDVLRRLGLRTVGRFAALPAPDVLARFGTVGMVAHRLANGAETEPPDLAAAVADFRVSAAIEPPAERVDRAAFIAKSLADTLHSELSARGLACTRVLVVAETDAGDRIERLWRHEGSLSAAAIAQRVRWQLDGWLSTGRSSGRCSGGVNRLELVPDQVVADDGVQLGFWGGTSEAGERAVRALARVQALLGPEAVLVPEWKGGRAPSEQYRLVPLDAVDLAARAVPGPHPWPGRVPTPSPAVVWPRALSAQVVDVEGRRVGVGGRGLISAAPHRCSVDGGPWVPVRAWAGPWCVDERWWDPIAHRRRARVQVVLGPPEDEPVDGSTGPRAVPTQGRSHPSAGAAHLLTLEASQWWLEATYD